MDIIITLCEFWFFLKKIFSLWHGGSFLVIFPFCTLLKIAFQPQTAHQIRDSRLEISTKNDPFLKFYSSEIWHATRSISGTHKYQGAQYRI